MESYKWWYDERAYALYHFIANIAILLLSIHMEWYGVTKLPNCPWYVALGGAGYRVTFAIWMLWVVKYIILIIAVPASMSAHTTPERPFLGKRFAIRLGLKWGPAALVLIALPLIVGYFGPLPRG